MAVTSASGKIADIGIILVVREKGLVGVRKVALLQSKRLYPDEQSFEEDVPLDYIIGFGGLMVDDDEDLANLSEREFHFDFGSRYKALSVGGDQWKRIENFEKTRGVPVHFLLYNPLVIPWHRSIPVEAGVKEPSELRQVGSKVARAKDLREAFDGKVGRNNIYPTFGE